MTDRHIYDQNGAEILDETIDPLFDSFEIITSFVPQGLESQVGVWRLSGKHARTGKRYRRY